MKYKLQVIVLPHYDEFCLKQLNEQTHMTLIKHKKK